MAPALPGTAVGPVRLRKTPANQSDLPSGGERFRPAGTDRDRHSWRRQGGGTLRRELASPFQGILRLPAQLADFSIEVNCLRNPTESLGGARRGVEPHFGTGQRRNGACRRRELGIRLTGIRHRKRAGSADCGFSEFRLPIFAHADLVTRAVDLHGVTVLGQFVSFG